MQDLHTQKQPPEAVPESVKHLYEVVKDHYLIVCWDCHTEAVALSRLGVPVVVYDPGKSVVGQGIPVATSLPELLAHTARRGGPNDMPLILCPDEVIGTPEHQRVHDICFEACITKKIKENTQRDRLKLLMGAYIENLQHTSEVPHIPGGAKPYEGYPVFIVSAGPSLDKNVRYLREASKIGYVMVVNTAVRPVLRYLPRIDIVVSIEAGSSQHHLEGTADRIDNCLVDLGAHPKTIEFARQTGRAIVFSPHHALVNRGNYLLGIPSVSYGASVATAAFSLALNGGASDIVLVGQDCAYADDGRVYASGTFYEDLRWEMHQGQVLSGKGSKYVQKLQPMQRVPAWGGDGEVTTVSDLLLFARWLSGVATTSSSSCRLWNCTEGGMRLDGFNDTSLKSFIRRHRPKKKPNSKKFSSLETVDSQSVRQLLETMRVGAQSALSSASMRDMMYHINSTPILREYCQVWQLPERGQEGASRVHSTPGGAPLYWNDGVATVDPRGVLERAVTTFLEHLEKTKHT